MFAYILATACLTCVPRTAVTSCVAQATTHTQPPVRTKGSSWDLGGSSSAVVRYVQLTWTETLEANFGRSTCTNRRCRVDSPKWIMGQYQSRLRPLFVQQPSPAVPTATTLLVWHPARPPAPTWQRPPNATPPPASKGASVQPALSWARTPACRTESVVAPSSTDTTL